MTEWIHNTHASYVLAAYAVALVALVGLAITTICDYRRHLKEWQSMSQDRADEV
jgi:heme exporter protein CcmD